MGEGGLVYLFAYVLTYLLRCLFAGSLARLFVCSLARLFAWLFACLFLLRLLIIKALFFYSLFWLGAAPILAVMVAATSRPITKVQGDSVTRFLALGIHQNMEGGGRYNGLYFFLFQFFKCLYKTIPYPNLSLFLFYSTLPYPYPTLPFPIPEQHLIF